jgi:alpha-1,3-rhamnosyl/mannosyltransferase
VTGPGSRAEVAVNLLWCVPGSVGGSEEYLVRQLTGFDDADFDLRLFVLRSFVDAHPDLSARFETIACDIDGRRRSRRVLAEHTWLARRTRSAAVVHHGGGTAPSTRSGPVVLTIHDLQYLTHPEYHSRVKLQYLRAVVPRSVRRAAVITTPTEWVRSTVIDEFGVDADRVMVVPHGVESTSGRDAPSEDELRRRYSLGDGPIVVFPAVTHPHKGHAFLLDVMARHWTDPAVRLVLLGGRGRADEQVAEKIATAGLGGRVVRPGRVSDADRDGLIAMATALAFPSEYEGFGAPVVEAMALGTPVVAADQPAVREVIGDAGIVLPRDVDAWARVLDDVTARRASLAEAGFRRARAFTIERSGAALAAAYRRARS